MTEEGYFMKVCEWLKDMDNIEIDDDLDQERNNLDPSEELELTELEGDNELTELEGDNDSKKNWLITMGRCPLKVKKNDAKYGCRLKLLVHWNDTEYLFRH